MQRSLSIPGIFVSLSLIIGLIACSDAEFELPEVAESQRAPLEMGAQAALVVTSLDDPAGEVAGTLRHAIKNVGRGGTITFAEGLEGTLLLRGEAMERSFASANENNRLDFTIEGPGPDKITLDGGGQSRIFYFGGQSSAFSDITLRGLSFANGMTSSSSGGGAVLAAGSLTIEECVFRDNEATNGSGGAINANQGAVTIRNSTFVDNESDEDGGALATGNSNAILTAENSTFFGNQAGRDGGAIFLIDGNGHSLNHVTITNNEAGRAGGGLRGWGDISIANSVIAGNRGVEFWYWGFRVNGTVDARYSLISDFTETNQNFDGPGVLKNVDPEFGEFADHGGPTPTVALTACSPALDGADPDTSFTLDQRGISRPYGDQADMGAVEMQGPLPLCNIVPPKITGEFEVCEELSVENGTWSEQSNIEFSYQWIRCEGGQDESCVEIAGATDETYVLGEDDRDKRVGVVVTATSAEGSASFRVNPWWVYPPEPATCQIVEVEELGDGEYRVYGEAVSEGACEVLSVKVSVNEMYMAEVAVEAEGLWSAELDIEGAGEVEISCAAVDARDVVGPEYGVSVLVDACWAVGLCDEGTGSCSVPVADEDQVSCSTNEICGGVCQEGQCTGGEPAECDDGNPCTTGICDADGEGCELVPLADGTSCGEATLCTEAWVCIAGGVYGGRGGCL